MEKENCGGPYVLKEMQLEEADIDGLNLILKYTIE